MLLFQRRWTRFELRRPRNPLLRAGVTLLGLAVFSLVLVLGLVAGLVMVAFGAVRWIAGAGRVDAAGASPRARQRDGVIEGEYHVVQRAHDKLFSR